MANNTNPGGYSGEDWKSQDETQLFTMDGYRTNKKGKKKPKFVPWTPDDPNNAGPGGSGSGSGSGIKAPASTAPASSNGGGYSQRGSHNSGPSTSTNPTTYDQQTNSAVERPFPGSFATNYSGVGSNPEALNMVATNPSYVANTLASQQFGLPAGSNTAGALAKYLSPQDKWMGILGNAPTSDADWINFGESLMNNPGLQQNGAQLSPGGMMGNVVDVMKQEFQAMAAGGAGSSDQFNPIQELARLPPDQALAGFTDMVKGMLSGTMPDNILTAYISFINRVGQQFAQDFVSSNQGDLEAQGANFLTALMDRLGPTLGL